MAHIVIYKPNKVDKAYVGVMDKQMEATISGLWIFNPNTGE